MGHLTSCRICGSHTRPFFNLGPQPLANSLLKRPEKIENKYPLVLDWCFYCNLVQLNYTVDPQKLFSKYVWVTATSKTARDFSTLFYKELIKRTPKAYENYVLEIGSNDGTFLLPFIKNGYKVIGIDPAKNIARVAKKNGVPTREEFWNSKTALGLLKEQGPARIIFARNVLPHVANTKDFVRGLARALQDDGVLAIETHYAGTILKELHYDSIYHEHLCYFTLKSLEHLLHKFGLFIFDMVKSPISGGSIIVYVAKKPRPEKPVVKRYRMIEAREGLNTLRVWKNFAKRSFDHRKRFLAFLEGLKKQNAVLAGWGASARSSTLLNFCGIDSRLIPVIADLNKLKQGFYTAGSHIKIKAPESVMKKRPTHLVLLAWNFAKEIIESLEQKFNYRGSYVTPLPYKPRLINSNRSKYDF